MNSWSWPQWSAIAWLALTLFAAVSLHGLPRTGHYDFPTMALVVALQAWILHAGGFFR